MTRLLPVLLALAAILGCGAESSDPSPSAEIQPGTAAGYDTPKAVFAAFKEAANDDDMPTVVSLLSPESQGVLVAGYIMAASFMTMDDEGKQKSLDALLRKYLPNVDGEPGPDDETGPEAMVGEIDDLPGFMLALSEWMSENGDDSGSGFAEVGELGEITISGNEASGQIETEMGMQPVEFRKIGGGWRIHMPSEPGEGGGGGADYAEDDGTPGLGALWIDDREFKLRHVTAYRTKFFDDPCTVVLLTARKVTEGQLDKLREQLAQGGDDEFFVGGPNVKLTLDESGEVLSLFAWADNMSINGDQGTIVEAKVDGNRIRGKASMPEPGEIFDSTYRFEVEFDTELVSAN
jgi:hypothetical protein